MPECVALLSVWWKVRNKCNAGESTTSSGSVRHQVMSLAADFEQYCSKENKSVQPAVGNKRKTLEYEVVKINIDGSMDLRIKSGGQGFVARDTQGEVVGSGAGYMQNVQDVLHTEAEACLQGLMQVQSWVFHAFTLRLIHSN